MSDLLINNKITHYLYKCTLILRHQQVEFVKVDGKEMKNRLKNEKNGEDERTSAKIHSSATVGAQENEVTPPASSSKNSVDVPCTIKDQRRQKNNQKVKMLSNDVFKISLYARMASVSFAIQMRLSIFLLC